ncbi:hypothetical protein GQ457_05G030190 [Hibiscus cannabinus]
MLMARLRGLEKGMESNYQPSLLRLELKLKRELDEVLEQEESLWYQKSRSDWIEMGDRNTSTAFCYESWLGRENRLASDCLIGMAPRPLMVVDMVSASSDWDWVRLRGLLPQHLLEQITAEVPPHYEAGPDIPSWRLEDRRVFTMKYAYDHIRVHNVIDGIAEPCWKRVWKLQVPQRVRVFLWLALHRRLFTNVERIRRHLTSMDRYECCLDGPEDMIHVLRDYFVARDLWLRVLPSTQLDIFSRTSADEWLRVNLFAPVGLLSISKEWPRKFTFFRWLLWKNRCCRVMGAECLHREELLGRGARLLEECTRMFHGRRTGVMRGPLEHWKCPPLGWIKVNVDAAVNVSDRKAVVGGFIRDSNGSWVFGHFRVIGRCSALMAELWAIYDALRRAWDKGFGFVEIESDCVDAVRMILGKSEVWMGHALVEEIKSLMRRD